MPSDLTDEIDTRPLGMPARPPRRRRFRTGTLILAGAACILGIGIYAGIKARADAETVLARATLEAAIPTVNVTHPKTGAPDQGLALPGNTQAFIDTPIYARTSGYLRRWYFDIGAKVKKGDLLAEIETPEVDQQLRVARADLATADANLKLADITAERYQNLLATHSVAMQDRDNAVGTQNADRAVVQSKQADVARLEQLQSYEKVYAPYDGIITARNTEMGALINAGAGSPTTELFHLASTDTLRIFVAVPELYSRTSHPGDAATVTLDEFPGETFHGTLARTSTVIDPASRTLLVEVDVDNPGGKLMPGAYAFVHFNLPGQASSMTIPANALLFRSEGLRVGVVRDGDAELVGIKIGRDYGNAVEVLDGLKATDDVILDPSDSLESGTKVRIDGAEGK